MVLDFIIILILALFGIGLIILEIFVIPGFGITGIGGIALMGGAIWFAYAHLRALGGHITLIFSIITLIICIYFFVKSKLLTKVSLKKEIDSHVSNSITDLIKVGDRGTTLSIINPMGTVLIDNQAVEAKSEEGFIESEEPVEVVRVETTRVIIKPIIH